ncbi:MAG: VIT1/CCC1 transporter family protein [Candidatus Omnitrophica bacterium]|nr:VIT1/CCC1 transporter family protein [Candidatus Omnitrophota bacterium]
MNEKAAVLTEELRKKILSMQRSEITDHIVYKKLSGIIKNKKYSQVLDRISQEELVHYGVFREVTGSEVPPDRLKIAIYVFVARLLGLNFGLRLMEGAEGIAQDAYLEIKDVSLKVEEVIKDEKTHESELISLIDEERLKYASSMVLGLNDALVELSGALVGFTLALQQTRLVGIVGLITGIAASMSMAASEFLSTKHEETDKDPLKASIYTGLAYVGTVVLLVTPYFIFRNIFFCLSLVIVNAILLILVFTFYISVAKGFNFKKRFLEMAGISLGIAAINFLIGLLIRKVFGIEV